MENYITYGIKLNLNKMGIYSGLNEKLWLSPEDIKNELSYLDEFMRERAIAFDIDRPNMLTDIANLYAEYFSEITDYTWVAEPNRYDDNDKLIDEIIISCFTSDKKILEKLPIIENKIKKMTPGEFEKNKIYCLKSDFSLLQNHIQWIYEI